MKEEKKRELEEKLKEMIELSEQGESGRIQMQQAQAFATKVIIRRRKGEQDKRIFLN